jgi:hypothetical protein
MNINIQPKEISLNITSIKIDIIKVILNELAIIKIYCFDINDRHIITYDLELIDEEYMLWKDDQDLINYVCEKYNFVLEIENNV